MIVTLHVLGHGANIWEMESGSLRGSILWLFETVALCSVNCFILISGFVGFSSRYKYSNLISLWFQVLFYSVSFTLIAKIVNPENVSNGDIVKAFFPVLGSQYWFFTSYFLLFLFIPILNKAVECVGKVKMGAALILIVFFVSVFGVVRNTIVGGDVFYVNDGYSPWWLIILYLIGAYIKKHRAFANIRKRWLICVFIASTVLTWSSKVLDQWVELPLFGEATYSDFFVNYTSVTVLISSVCLLLLFSRLTIRNILCRIIAFFTPLCFGVYLIHDNVFIRNSIVSGRFYFFNTIAIPKMLLAIVVSVIGVFLVCSLIDYIRFWLFKLLKVKPRLSNLIIKLSERIKRRVDL